MSYSASHEMIRSNGRVPWMVVLGGLLVVAGLALLVFAVSTRDDSPLFMLGGIVVGAGALRLTTALSSEARRRRNHPVDENDPRWQNSTAPMQLAGRLCVECGHRIVIGSEAMSCEQCSAPAHIECRDHHHARAHNPEAQFSR